MCLSKQFRIVFLFSSVLISALLMADIPILDYVKLDWAGRSYTVVVPPPFNEVRLSIEENDDRSVSRIELLINGKEKLVDDALLSGLKLLSEPSVSFDEAHMLDDGSVSQFSILFSYGEDKITNKVIINCKDSFCDDWFKNHVIFTVDDKGIITREILSIEESEIDLNAGYIDCCNSR